MHKAGIAAALAAPSRRTAVAEARVALVGTGGYGRWHLANIERLEAAGVARLVAVADRDSSALAAVADPAVRAFTEAEEMLKAVRPDITVIAAPLPVHLDLAMAALHADSDVLLEKPPVLGTADLEQLLEAERETGRMVQVGFQSLGSHALPYLRAMMERGELGWILGVGAAGAWIRPDAYFTRSAWSGRRELDGRPVMDGALTNPFAHAVSTALALVAPGEADDSEPVEWAEMELYHANDIRSDDTSCIRVQVQGAPQIVIAATLCSPVDEEPYVVVHGTAGRATLRYTSDKLVVERDGEPAVHRTFGRTDLLENLIDVRRGDGELLAPLRATRSFTDVVEAVRLAPDPTQIHPAHWHREGTGADSRHVVPEAHVAVREAAARLELFSELGLPWTLPEAYSIWTPR